MSALAARRAAEAARLSRSAAPSKSATPAPSVYATPAPAPAPQSPSASSPSPSLASPEPAPASSYRRPPAALAKRQKSSPATRYFAGAEPEAGPSKRQRQFSPSAPADADGTSDGDEGGDEDEDEDHEDGPGRTATPYAPWIASPAEPEVPRLDLATVSATSTFAPLPGVNLHILDASELERAGIAVPGAVISLDASDTLVLAGIFIVRPLLGSVRVFSSTLSPGSSNNVFAPTSHPLPVFRAQPTPASDELLEQLRLPKTFMLDERSVFLLSEHQTGLERLRGNIVPGFSNIWVDDRTTWGMKGVHPVIGSFPIPVYPHVEPPSWAAALASLADPAAADDDAYGAYDAPDRAPAVLVKGPKRSGKSSLGRAAVNALLETHARVAWLECDLGQGEFGPGGSVGLWILDRAVLGPPFTHPRLPERAVYLGELSPQSCPDAYLSALRTLHDHYMYAIETSGGGGGVPLVVNTQGWVKGLGDDLLRAIEGFVCPTHVFQFPLHDTSGADDEPAAGGGGWSTSPVYPTLDLPPSPSPAHVLMLEPAPASPLLARYTPADLRVLGMLSYFHARFAPSPAPAAPAPAAVSWDWSAPLLAAPCWEVELGTSGALRRVYLIGEGGAGIAEPDLALALNGHVVALVRVSAEGDGSGDDSGVYTRGREPDDADALGLALVRAVRATPAGLRLQLVSPLPARVLARVNAVVRNGAVEMPSCGMADWREGGARGPADSDDVPFFDERDVDVVGGERRRVRRNLQRKGM
ncbi:Polynucleotide 5'-hydroxyl-kinase grc3 [Cryptotrichosporon argae]